MKFYLLNFGPQILTIILGLISIRRLTLPYCLILFQILFSVFTDFFALQYLNFHASNEIVYNIYLIIETALLTSAIFYSIHSNNVKKILGIALITYLFSVLLIFSKSSFLQINYQLLITGFIIIAFSNLFYIINPSTEKSILKNPFLIFAISHVIYFLGVTPYFVARQMIITDSPEMEYTLFSYINMTLMIVRYSFCAFAFFIVLRKNIALQVS
jgi:hypothetical protein